LLWVINVSTLTFKHRIYREKREAPGDKKFFLDLTKKKKNPEEREVSFPNIRSGRSKGEVFLHAKGEGRRGEGGSARLKKKEQQRRSIKIEG